MGGGIIIVDLSTPSSSTESMWMVFNGSFLLFPRAETGEGTRAHVHMHRDVAYLPLPLRADRLRLADVDLMDHVYVATATGGSGVEKPTSIETTAFDRAMSM